MKILLFGKNGQVGWELNRSLQPLGDVVALGRDEVDFSNPESLRGIIQSVNPDVIVNAVAYTAVDMAEQDEGLALLVNGESLKVLAQEALKVSALLVHYSTDYVFDGKKESPYVEGDIPNPINAYGRTKLAGEMEVQSSGCDYLIFRTSWVYSSRGKNFLLTVLKLVQERDELSIVADQVGAPTSARLIADTTVLSVHRAMDARLSGTFNSNLFHLSASGNASWYEFAKVIIDRLSDEPGFEIKTKNLKKIATSEYNAPAKRPMNSLLSQKKLQDWLHVNMPSWQSSLSLCLNELIEKN